MRTRVQAWAECSGRRLRHVRMGAARRRLWPAEAAWMSMMLRRLWQGRRTSGRSWRCWRTARGGPWHRARPRHWNGSVTGRLGRYSGRPIHSSSTVAAAAAAGTGRRCGAAPMRTPTTAPTARVGVTGGPAVAVQECLPPARKAHSMPATAVQQCSPAAAALTPAQVRPSVRRQTANARASAPSATAATAAVAATAAAAAAPAAAAPSV
mmetsp:Transcript_20537/g.61211  ORF Transcript_20537/g.61211 Transcript_20537/m.61211 type:complete len:209 (-) Transcript_20537:975-1601(-)